MLSIGCSCKKTVQEKTKADFDLTFVTSSSRPSDRGIMTWVTLKVRNTGNISFSKNNKYALDLDTNTSLYGGYYSMGFSDSPDIYSADKIQQLAPNETGYISFNIGKPVGNKIKVTIKLTGIESPIKVKKSVVFKLPEKVEIWRN